MNYRVVVIVSCVVGLAFGYAPVFNQTMPVFMKSIVADLHWSRTQVSSGVSISLIAQAVAAFFFGSLQDRVGPRWMIMAGCVMFPAALLCFWMLPVSYVVYCMIAAVIGAFGTGTCPLAHLSVLPRWFDRRLGLALGLANSGIGIGYALTPLIAQALLARFEWRESYAIMALVVLAITLPNAWLLRESPDTKSSQESRDEAARGITWQQCRRTPAFWTMALSFFLMMIVIGGSAVHLAAIATDRGASALSAAGAVSVLGAAVLAGRFATGALLDELPVAIVACSVFLFGALGAGLLCLGISGAWLYLSAALLGFAQGAEGDLLAYLVRRTFGLQAFGTIFGRVFVAFTLGAALGPVVMGYSFDHLQTYTPMLATFTLLALAAAGLALTFRPLTQPAFRTLPA